MQILVAIFHKYYRPQGGRSNKARKYIMYKS